MRPRRGFSPYTGPNAVKATVALPEGPVTGTLVRLTEFDEGPLPADWVGELERRGIAVSRDLHREAACEVLRAYGALGGTFY